MNIDINYFGDFETTTSKYCEDQAFLICYTFRSQISNKHYTGVKFKDFWNDILKAKVETMYFHNLSWDGEFIVWDLIENGYEFVESKFDIKEDKQFTWLKTDTGRIYTITVRYEGHTITFLDSYALIPISVENIGKMIGTYKLDADYDKHTPVERLEDLDQQYVEYMKRDVDIVVEYFNKFSKNWTDYKMTIGSTVKENIVKRYGLKKWVNDFGGRYFDWNLMVWNYNHVLTQEEWEELQHGYRGGYVMINPKHENKILEGDIRSYDENSAYPAVMTEKLPYGSPLKYKPKGSYMTIYKIHIWETKIKDKGMPPHLYAHDSFGRFSQKYLDECKDSVYIFIDEEFEEIKKTYEMVEGENYDIVEEWYFKTKYTHKAWVEDKYKLKSNASDGVTKLNAKFGLNNAYGKEGQAIFMSKKILTYEGEPSEGEIRLGSWYGNWCESLVEEESKTYSYIPLAITITAKARVRLIKAIRANKENFIYCDTDSIYLFGEMKGDFDLHPTRLGAWDLEKKGVKFKAIKPKCYIIELQDGTISRTISGLPAKGHQYINFDNFNDGYTLEGVKLAKKRVKGGLLLVETPFTL